MKPFFKDSERYKVVHQSAAQSDKSASKEIRGVPRHHCLSVCFFPSPYSETLIPRVMTLGGGDLGRHLGHEDGAPLKEIRVLIKEL